MITNTMSSFSQKAELEETIIEKVIERMLYFMKDTSPLVRTQAVFALQRLQDPENTNEDPVTKAFIYHMESDPVPKVRQAAITAIAKKLTNIPAVLERLYDVDEKVRRHTYQQMASYSVKSYKIADRINILNAGLNDRSDLVKKSVNNLLLSNWIGVYDYDYAEFIRAIKLDSNEQELIKFRGLAEMALTEIFK
jgi:condensin complex subunit 3